MSEAKPALLTTISLPEEKGTAEEEKSCLWQKQTHHITATPPKMAKPANPNVQDCPSLTPTSLSLPLLWQEDPVPDTSSGVAKFNFISAAKRPG